MTIVRGTRWEPFWGQLHQFQNDLNQLFNRWGDGGVFNTPATFPAVNVWEEGDQVRLEVELPGMDLKDVDIYETDKELTLFADLPGVAPNDVDLHYEKGELVLRGKVKPSPNARGRTLLLEEYEVGDFYRVFSIHESIDAGRIEAECKNG